MENIIDDRWLEIDSAAIKHNLKQVQAILKEGVRLIAIVKADAYGHGAVESAKILFENGVEYFGVSFLDEALALRYAGISANIILLAPLISPEQLNLAVNNQITVSLTSLFECSLLDQIIREKKTQVTVHLKLDTGLGRFGMNQHEVFSACQTLKNNPCIYIEGIYTHMAEPTRNANYTRKQFKLFMNTVEFLRENGFIIPLCHCANSAVFLKYPEMHLNAVRIGTLLSGELPVGNYNNPIKLKNPYRYKTRILSLKTLPKGSYLGYYRTARLREDAQIAVIPVGFRHGLALTVGNRPAGFMDLLRILVKNILAYFNVPRLVPKVKINGKEFPVRGKVFMQMALVEIPLNFTVKIGDEVEVPVRKTLASPSLKRIYIKEKETVG
ncbi:MAG: alanine racemase [Syntrophomonadaceae bacterium]